MDWISSLLLATVRLAIPLLLISLAELYGQRAGMVNIGLEGLAAIGALVGFLACYITGSNWLGLLCGALAGLLVNMIYAFSTVTLCADHTVYGMAINIFAPALASFIYRVYFGTGSDLKQIVTMPSVAIPGLKDIPVIGPLLFDQSPMVYLTILLVVFTSVFFNRTRAPRGRAPTSTAERAGYCPSVKNSAYTAFMAAKSLIFCRNTVVLTTLSMVRPAASRIAFTLVST